MVKAGFQDGRFRPLQFLELSLTNCYVSVLYEFTEGANCWDWTPGEHGIIINFSDPSYEKRRYQATYLPEVPVEHEMSKQYAIESLVRK